MSCNSAFENPLPWNTSSSADLLIGNWELVSEDDIGELRIDKSQSGSYVFEFSNTEGRSSISGNILSGSNLLEVIQFRLDTFSVIGQSDLNAAQGYSFVRVDHSRTDQLILQEIDLEKIEKLIDKGEMSFSTSNRCIENYPLKPNTDNKPNSTGAGFIDKKRCKVLSLSSNDLSKLLIENADIVFSGDQTIFARSSEEREK